ncbi:MAG: NADP-dependent oxidoreductase [Thermoplasmata archaeon]|nr:NADP-dependent oxidoreductase [Thermoplasmata archaeon]
MRAVAVRAFRAPMELMDVPVPKPGDGELLVRLHAASINPFDWKLADGMLEGMAPHTFPLILGVDGAGVVESVGPKATRFRVGDPVFGQFSHPPFGIGTYADFVTAPDDLGLATYPSTLTPVQAAALPTAGMTALVALDTLGLQRGQRLLLVGASGGIGSFVVPLAVARGADVLAVTQPAKAGYLRERGATEIFDRSQGPITDQVRAAHPQGVDALLDLVSDAVGFASHATLVRDGGVAATPVSAAFSGLPSTERIRVTPINLTPTSALLERVVHEVVDGRLTVPLESVVPLEQAAAAVAANRAGKTAGKTGIRIV